MGLTEGYEAPEAFDRSGSDLCPLDQRKEISVRLREIKTRHRALTTSPAKLALVKRLKERSRLAEGDHRPLYRSENRSASNSRSVITRPASLKQKAL